MQDVSLIKASCILAYENMLDGDTQKWVRSESYI